MSEQTIPVLGEHESVKSVNTTNPSEYTPTNEERKALKLVEKCFQKAKKHRKQYDEHWLEYYKMFRGKQWKEQRPSYRHAEVINFIFQTVQSQVPIVTDTRPKFEYTPENPADREFAEIINEVAESDWISQNWSYKLTECVYDSHIYGTALSEVPFDPKAMDGMGQIGFASRDIFYCFPAPKARDVNEECEYFVYAEPVEIEKLKKEYPDKAGFIKPDLIDLMQGDKVDLDEVRFKSPVDSKTIMDGTSAYEAADKNEALKITLYIKDDEFYDEPQESLAADGTPTTKYVQKLKYPNGRKVCIAGGVVLHDGPIPYDDGLFPFCRLVNYMDPRSFWGISEIEQLKSPQKIFNKLLSFALDVLTLMGNPIWKVGTGSGVDTDALFNRPGLIIEADDISQVQREEGVELQPYVLNIADRVKDYVDSISGSQEVSRGVKPEGIQAAAAINSLQEAAQTRIRLKSRNLDAFLQNFGQMYLSRVMQFYTVPRIIRITDNQNAQKYFKFHIESRVDEDGNEKKVARVRPYAMDPGGQMVMGEERQLEIQGKLDVRVNTGSTLPFVKDQKMNLGFKLFEAGAIPRRELLKSVEWPNWEAIEEEMAAKEQEAAMLEAQAAQGGAGGAAPPPPAA